MTQADRAGVVSSFTIIKGSMIDETYTVLRSWDFERSREENLRQMKETNAIGATSANWLRDVGFVINRRFDPSGRDRPLAELAQAGCRYDVWKPILLWHMTRDEFLVRDFLIGWLYPRFVEGILRVHTSDLDPYLEGLADRGVIEKRWSDSTRRRVASGLLRIATDFGLMRGTVAREFESYHLPEASLLYMLHALSDAHPNARDVVHAPDWRMYLMDADAVERELFHLHQYRRLHYDVAGSLAQLSLPCPTAADYAHELTA